MQNIPGCRNNITLLEHRMDFNSPVKLNIKVNLEPTPITEHKFNVLVTQNLF